MIIEFLKEQKNQKIILFVIIFLLIFGMIKCNSDKNDNIALLKNNIEAIQDSIKITTTKNGQLEYEKMVLIGDLKTIKQLNSDLAIELKKEKGKVKIIEVFKVKYIHDTIYIDTTKVYRINDSMYRLEWDYKHYSKSLVREFQGMNYFTIDSSRNIHDAHTIITSDCLSLNLVTGLKTIDGKHKIFVRLKDKEDENLVSFDELEGAVLDESLFDKPSWSFGVYAGFGVSGPVTEFKIYPTINWQVGIGLQYKFFNF